MIKDDNNMDKLFSIGEVSNIKNITIKALRYYHKVGILQPKYIDERTGYRYYSIDQFVYIDIIKGCRALGTSISDLQNIFKDCDTDKLVEFLKLKKYQAKENINKMEKVIEHIDILTSGIEKSQEILKQGNISISYFDERQIVICPCREVGSLKELLYYSDLEKIIAEKKINVTAQRGVIYKIGKVVEPEYVFSGIQNEINLERSKNIMILDKGRYLTMTYNKQNEENSKIKLMNYINNNNLKIRNIIELDLLNNVFETDNYSCQVQIYLEE